MDNGRKVCLLMIVLNNLLLAASTGLTQIHEEYVYYFMDELVTWDQARDSCEASGRALASIHNSQENDFLRDALSSNGWNYLWIGLYLSSAFDECTCVSRWNRHRCSDCRDQYQWTDGSTVTYEQWSYYEPRDNQRCARVGQSSWNADPCHYTNGFLCKSHLCNAVDCGQGNCTVYNSELACECDPGFTGLQCETDIDECVSSPCLNGGTCYDYINEFTCTCEQGYTGFICDTQGTDPYNNSTIYDMRKVSESKDLLKAFITGSILLGVCLIILAVTVFIYIRDPYRTKQQRGTNQIEACAEQL